MTRATQRLTAADAAALSDCVSGGGVALFPADTVYGLACDPESAAAADRLYRLKGRRPERPAALMFFSVEALVDALPQLGPRTRAVLARLLPGAVTLVLPNHARRYPVACGRWPERIGVRVPALAPAIAALRSVPRPVLQSSANRSGEPDARRLGDVDPAIRDGADLVLDGGELPGTPSTVVDMTAYEHDGAFAVLREGAVARARVEALLSPGRTG